MRRPSARGGRVQPGAVKSAARRRLKMASRPNKAFIEPYMYMTSIKQPLRQF